MLVQQFETLGDEGRFEQLLLVVGGEEGQRGGDKVDQTAGVVNVGGDGAELVGQSRRLGNNLLELADHVAHQRFNTGGRRAGGGCRLNVGEDFDLGHQKGFRLGVAEEPNARCALRKDEAALVGHAHHLVNRGQGSHRVQVSGLGGVEPGVQLGRNYNGSFISQRLDELNGAFAAHGQGQNGVGKQDGVPNGKDGDSTDSGGVPGGSISGSGRDGGLI